MQTSSSESKDSSTRPSPRLISVPTRFTANRASESGDAQDQASPTEASDSVQAGLAPRRAAARVPSITALRLLPSSGETSLVDISSSGVLVKSSGKLNPGTAVTVVLDGTFAPSSIESRVARCVVADIDSRGRLWYHIGVSFKEPIDLDAASSGTRSLPTSDAPSRKVLSASTISSVRNRW